MQKDKEQKEDVIQDNKIRTMMKKMNCVIPHKEGVGCKME